MKLLTILIPSFERKTSLSVLLTSLYYQDFTDFDIIVSDQSTDYNIHDDRLIHILILLLQQKNIQVSLVQNFPRQGIAQQRQFLLERCNTPFCLYLDDDLVLEPWVIRNLIQMIRTYQCGFVGNAVIGLSYSEDRRPDQQQIEFWEDKIEPEQILPYTDEWNRYLLHNAANILHIQQSLNILPDHPRPYKIAWCGGCVLYDRAKLLDCGGFSFWTSLPVNHCGEDVLAQLQVMGKYGGCGIIPSGVYHQELPTTVPDRSCNAPEFFKPQFHEYSC